MDNVLDLLQQATVTLSQGGSIKERLAEAYSLHLIRVDAGDLPDHLRNEFSQLHAALHREPPLPRESAIRASIRKMSIADASRYAALVVQIFAALARSTTPAIAWRGARAAPVVALLAAEA